MNFFSMVGHNPSPYKMAVLNPSSPNQILRTFFPGTKETEPFCAELLVGPFVEGRGCALPFCRDLVGPFCSRQGLCLAILVEIAKPYPTPIAWRGCDLDFLVRNHFFWGGRHRKSETYHPKKSKNIATKSTVQPTCSGAPMPTLSKIHLYKNEMSTSAANK